MARLDHGVQIGRTTSNGAFKPCTKQSIQMKKASISECSILLIRIALLTVYFGLFSTGTSNKKPTSSIVEERVETLDEVVVDDSYVFRGFLAWCLWGWIPIQTGAKIKSSLFSNCKVNASYVSGIGTANASGKPCCCPNILRFTILELFQC